MGKETKQNLLKSNLLKSLIDGLLLVLFLFFLQLRIFSWRVITKWNSVVLRMIMS